MNSPQVSVKETMVECIEVIYDNVSFVELMDDELNELVLFVEQLPEFYTRVVCSNKVADILDEIGEHKKIWINNQVLEESQNRWQLQKDSWRLLQSENLC